MELRVLNYFLTVAREGGLTGASEVLHVTQPTMSRQLRELEEELGQKLFIRRSHSLELTAEGMILRKRAEEMLALAEKTKAEFIAMGSAVAGDIFIGSAETRSLHLLTQIMNALRNAYPQIRYHLYSGNAEDVTERLDKGLVDFGVLVEPVEVSKYHSLRLPATDTWGLVMPKNHPLAERDHIRREDLQGVPLIVSRQTLTQHRRGSAYTDWFAGDDKDLNIVATFNLMYNAALMVASGIGCAIGLEGIVNTTESADLCFRPLEPLLEAGIVVIWKKYQVFTGPAELFLESMTKAFGE